MTRVDCTLPPSDLAQQTERWVSVMGLARRRDRSAGAFVVHFESSCADRVAALIEVERGCCSWASWTLTRSEDEVILEVEGPPGRTAALADALGL